MDSEPADSQKPLCRDFVWESLIALCVSFRRGGVRNRNLSLLITREIREPRPTSAQIRTDLQERSLSTGFLNGIIEGRTLVQRPVRNHLPKGPKGTKLYLLTCRCVFPKTGSPLLSTHRHLFQHRAQSRDRHSCIYDTRLLFRRFACL
jgi:hypothetical protein